MTMERKDVTPDASLPPPIDVGIVVALREEFEVLLYDIDYRPEKYAPENLVFYFFSAPPKPKVPNSRYRCVATFIGEMGPTSAAVAAERLLHLFSPITIVNIGICGAMSADVKVGDVVVGDVIDEYISAAKAFCSVQSEIPLRLSGKPYTTTRDYLLECEHIQFTKPERFKKWQSSCGSRLEELAGDHQEIKKLLDGGILYNVPSFHKGHVASGPIVSGATSYKEFLLCFRDRKYVAVEMEAAGVMAAAADRTTRTMVLRGVCDSGDENKLADAKRGCEGALRQLAMRNAVEFLWMIMELDLLYLGRETSFAEEQVSSAGEILEIGEGGLREPDHEISFRYLPSSIQLHGWRIGLRDSSVPAPQIRATPDRHFQTTLCVEGPLTARLEYDAAEDIGDVHSVDVLLIECGPYYFYIRIEVRKEEVTRSVWLNVRPGTAEPKPLNNKEWSYEVPPRSGPGEWKALEVDLNEAVRVTFGTRGWQFGKLLGFRIRGTVRIARIGLFVKGDHGVTS